MKNTIKYATAALLFFLCHSLQGQTYSNHRAVQAYAKWNESDLSVTLRWKWESNAQSYAIFKRVYGTESWGSSIANLTSADSFYQDKNVDASSIYEYTVEKTTTITDPFNRPNKLKGHAYISTAHQKPVVHSRGVIGLLVMDYIDNSLSSEIRNTRVDSEASKNIRQ